MRSFLLKFWPIFALVFLVLLFFRPFFLEGKLPVPADTIVGIYHPWRDFYVKDYPNGIPFKNFLITDPVRQQYVWRHLTIESLKNGQLPLWNSYNFSGTPLLANFQSAPFYPLNILFFVLPFNFTWAILVFFQPLLAGIFLYLYLRNLNLGKVASFIGSLVFSFSGFSIAWLEWNTVLHTALWLPLILLSIDKIFISYINISYKTIWSGIFLFTLIASFFGGHLQIFFYVFVFSLGYLFLRWWQNGKKIKPVILFAIYYLLFAIATAIQWWSTIQFIKLSARQFDLPNWQTSSWFLPPQHLIQFLAPDFFGNPATLNYWGEWNYGEFVGYIGILPLIFAILAILYRRDKKTWVFISVVITSLLFALPTPLAKVAYLWQIPLISTSQPTRLLFLVDFSLAILAALGLDWFVNHLNDSNQLSKIAKSVLIVGLIFCGLWIFVIFGQRWFSTIAGENFLIAKRNLILPSILFIGSLGLFLISLLLKRRRGSTTIIYIIIVGITVFDLFRFGWKFTPFSKEELLFPKTEVIKFLENQPKPFRFMTTDRRIFPPNFAIFYRLEDVSGYDPLYLKSYGELVAAWNRGKPDISPFSFNRILTPQDYSSKIADLLSIKYVLSLKDETSPKLKLVFQEGQTRIYENKKVLPRTFFVEEVKWVDGKEEAIKMIFADNFDPRKMAIVEKTQGVKGIPPLGCKGCSVRIVERGENSVVLETENEREGFLVLLETFYPNWQGKIDGTATIIYPTDYNFKGVIVPAGKHQIEVSFKYL